MSVQESTSTAEQFLMFQLNGVAEGMLQFLETLSKVLNRETKKRAVLK
jgi:hypothetical protein